MPGRYGNKSNTQVGSQYYICTAVVIVQWNICGLTELYDHPVHFLFRQRHLAPRARRRLAAVLRGAVSNVGMTRAHAGKAAAAAAEEHAFVVRFKRTRAHAGKKEGRKERKPHAELKLS